MRKKDEPRALGPYPRPNGKFLVAFFGGGDRGSRRKNEIFDNFEEAKRKADAFNLLAQGTIKLSLKKAIERYLDYCKEKGLKQSTRETYQYRLFAFFPVAEQGRLVRDISTEYCQKRYNVLAAEQKPDTHRNTLLEVKRFMNWCVKGKLIEKNPTTEIEGKGRRHKRKAQLRLNEARKFVSYAEELLAALKLPDPVAALSLYGIRPPGWYHGPAQREEYRGRMRAGIVAALSALLLGATTSELVQRTVRDLDDEGHLLHIEENEDSDVKTENRERILEVSDLLRPHLLLLAKDKKPEALLFGERDRRWVLHWVKRLCALAGVKVVTAHGLRGSFASIARAQGAMTHLVSSTLGHGGEGVTLGHYIDPGSVRNGDMKAGIDRLKKPTPKEATEEVPETQPEA